MWAPFFELPKDIGCECTGSNAPAPADEEAPVRANDVPAPPTSDAKVQGSSSSSSAVTGAVTGAGSKPLRPGAVGIGSHAPELQVQGLRIRGGSGRCLASVPLVQDRAYWEIHVVEVGQQIGTLLLAGVAAQGPDDHLQQRLGATARSFGVQFGTSEPLKVGDVIGIACNQATFPVSVTAWHNGAPVPAPMPRGLKGELWPALFVSDCVVDWALAESHWKENTSRPQGFEAPMPSRGLIGGD
ncbi:unnamed protein product [Cladocopium goreaui]|uniref:SPRY domain-containing protein n=1 Tax=Cladocopium goreaui TaxID=2562237 RepID=A0A9P1GB66_9DINO|nr:unnamed protein product [Cladocopium goreaui]